MKVDGQALSVDESIGDLTGLRFAVIGSRGYPSTYGGFETLVRHLAPYLAEAGAHVAVYGRCPRQGTAVHDSVISINTRGLPRKSTSTLTFGATSLLHARNEAYDAALVLNVANGPFLPILHRRTPCAVNVDGLEWQRANWSRLGRQVIWQGAKATARFADEIVCDSMAIQGYWERTFGRTSMFIPYGASVRRNVGRDRLRDVRLESTTYVLAVARLIPENNVDLFLEAAASLPAGVQAVLVGSAPAPCPLEDRVRAAADAGVVQWLGHVSDQDLLTQLWANAAVYFHGHSAGGTNPALLQAMGAGSPVVAFDTEFTREVLTDDGHFVADAPSLAALVRALIADPELRALSSERGRSIVGQRYRWEDVCARYTRLLVQLAGQSVEAETVRVAS